MSAAVLEWNDRWPLRTFVRWCRNIDTASRLDACGEQEIEHIAKDIGLAPAELLDLAGAGEQAADLLPRRMAMLDLDPDEVGRISPRILQDLQRVCTLCRSQRRCARDPGRHATDPAWKTYCPNFGTLTALDAMPWSSRSEW